MKLKAESIGDENIQRFSLPRSPASQSHGQFAIAGCSSKPLTSRVSFASDQPSILER